MNQYIDIGANLTHKSLFNSIDTIIQRAESAAIKHIVVTGTSISDSQQAVELCEHYPRFLSCTAGVHPHHADEWENSSGALIKALAQRPGVRAIGETGLDFNRDFSPRDQQITAFTQQLELASVLRLPVFSHQRDAHDSFSAIIREHRNKLGPIVVHCFTDTRDALRDYLDLDCHIGITGWICDERRGVELQNLVQYIPSDRLMIETDSPYLLPRDMKPRPRSRTNEPMYLPHILQTIAGFQHKSLELAARECFDTSCRFFGLQIPE